MENNCKQQCLFQTGTAAGVCRTYSGHITWLGTIFHVGSLLMNCRAETVSDMRVKEGVLGKQNTNDGFLPVCVRGGREEWGA